MLQPVFDFFNKLIDEFSWKRLAFVFIVFILIIASFYIYEKYTSHFALSKAEKTIQLVQEIAKLPPEVREQSNATLSNIISSVASHIQNISNTESLSFNIHPKLQKFIAAVIPWIFMLFLAPLISNDDLKTLIFGLILCGAIFGVIGMFIPPENPNWVNFWLYPIGHFVIVLYLLVIIGNKKS